MRAYVIKRLLILIPTILILSMLAFSIIRLIPGSAVELMLEEHGYAENIAELKHVLGLDKPIFTQYIDWLWRALHADLGVSLWSKLSIIQLGWAAFLVTFELSVLALFFSIFFGIPLGVFSAVRQDTIVDYLARSVAIASLSAPTFWLGTLCVVFFSIYLKWTPPPILTSFFHDPLTNLSQYIIPSVILGLVFAGSTMRMSRTMMLEVMRQDYIRTAWAKGLREGIIVSRHAMRNALIPVISVIGINFPKLLGGAVVVESIFNLPGIGRLALNSLNNRDYPLVSGIVLFLGVIVVFVNLIVDISYSYLDPKIRYR